MNWRSDTQELLGEYMERGAILASFEQPDCVLSASEWRTALDLFSGSVDSDEKFSRGCQLICWNCIPSASRDGWLNLVVGPRTASGDLSDDAVRAAATDSHSSVNAKILPPFAAFVATRGGASAVCDELGFRHLYRRAGDGWCGISTSARSLALIEEAEFDLASIATNSLLGWQVSAQTWFQGVEKCGPGEIVTIADGALEYYRPTGTRVHHAFVDLDDATRKAAGLLRDIVVAYIVEHPESVLQLTGGLDSRLLLAAMPREMRAQTDTMTLATTGSADVAIAAKLAAKYDMRHEVRSMDGLHALDPAAAFRLCLTAARRLESSVDPIAAAAVDFAELHSGGRPRIAGLGGEVARGFYYLGRPRDVPVTRRRVDRLAKWRMFTNESAPAEMFTEDFRSSRFNFAIEAVYEAFLKTERGWFDAMDSFYLHQRVHRWAGTLASASAMERTIVNPMLDSEFLAIVNSVPPQYKASARFLSGILVELDDDLARIPLESRPSPETYAEPTLRHRIQLARVTSKKASGKVIQRFSRANRPPNGGAVLAAKVVEYWRREPEALGDIVDCGLLDDRWIDRMLQPEEPISVAATAFIVNLIAARGMPISQMRD